MTENEIDPNDYSNITRFKNAVYDKHGAGSWMDDIKLTIIYREAHGIELDDYMKPLVE